MIHVLTSQLLLISYLCLELFHCQCLRHNFEENCWVQSLSGGV